MSIWHVSGTAGTQCYWLNTELALLLLLNWDPAAACKGRGPSGGDAPAPGQEAATGADAQDDDPLATELLPSLTQTTASSNGWGPSTEQLESLPGLPQRLPSQHACREAPHAVISAVWRHLCCVTRVTSVWTSWRTSGQHCVCDVRTILLSMQGLLGEPNINSALNTHAKFWRNNLLQETYSEQVSLQMPWRDCLLSPCVVFSFSSGGLSFLWFLCRKPVLVSCGAIVWFLFI